MVGHFVIVGQFLYKKKKGLFFQHSMTVWWVYFSHSIVISYNIMSNKISIE